MVHAKHEHQSRARDLRRAGMTYDEIVQELGVSKSSVSLWVRDIPVARRPRDQAAVHAHMDMMRAVQTANAREKRERAEEQARATGLADVGRLFDRELFLIGVGLYWSEGVKSKPHRVCHRINFVNSDPDMIRFFLAWLRLLGIVPEQMRFHLMIHESADVEGAERFWRAVTGASSDRFLKTTLKKHNPQTLRKNVGEGYRGCLSVRVLQGADLYRRVEGWWYGIVGAVEQSGLLPQP